MIVLQSLICMQAKFYDICRNYLEPPNLGLKIRIADISYRKFVPHKLHPSVRILKTIIYFLLI